MPQSKLSFFRNRLGKTANAISTLCKAPPVFIELIFSALSLLENSLVQRAMKQVMKDDAHAGHANRTRGNFVKPESRRVPTFSGIKGRKLCLVIAAMTASAILQCVDASAQETTRTPTELTLAQVVEKLLQRNAERAKALESYRSKRTYELDYKGFPSGLRAEMTVAVNYNAPDEKDFKIVSESGPKWIVNRVLRRLIETEREAQKPANRAKVELNTRNYDFTSLKHLPSVDGCAYVLSVQPKVANKFLYRGRIWVNEKDFAVCRIEAEPAQNPSMWITKIEIRHRYQKIGDFWLPVENQSLSSLRLNGRATLTIKYLDYEINSSPIAREVASAPAGH